ncbi:MAG: porin [Bacteroidota bacterium]
MTKKIICSLFAAVGGLIPLQMFSQEDTLRKTLESIQSDIKNLKKLKISGYIQAQAQFADSNGISSFAGGSFPANTDKRFAVRRGRVKFAYNNGLSQYVMQIDVTQGGVGIKDAYVRFTEPWAKTLHVTMGVFDRPFGFEIGYSSSSRETPERGRMSQIIFPGERELGLMLTFQRPKGTAWNFLKIDAGMFNGSGSTASDFDYFKDFIGRIRIDRTTISEKITYGLGASFYNGGYRQPNRKVYASGTDSLGLTVFALDKDTALFGPMPMAKRQYMGADFQLSIDWVAGITTLRAEYIQGVQSGTSSTSTSPSAQPASDTYVRNFNGAYFYFIQNIAQSKHQLVVKYDWYDPNTDVAGDDIGKPISGSASGLKTTGRSDLKYTTIGLGWTYRWDANLKLVLYYDMVANETSKNVSGYTKDLRDNVVTFRAQYRF